MDKKTKRIFNMIAIICIIIFCAAIAPKALQNDTFYTIKIGENIVNNGIHMEQDPFSIHDIPYTYPHWLYDVGIYSIYNLTGMTGIYLSTVILACILGIVIYITNKKIVKNDLISFLLTIGTIYVLGGFIAARAQLVTYILFALQIFFIEKFLETKKKRYAIGLIAIPIIIANVHLAVWPFYFIPFLPYIAEYLIASIVDMHIIYKIEKKLRQIQMNRLIKKNASEEVKAKLEQKNAIKEEKFANFKSNQEKRRKNPYKIKITKKDSVKWLILIMIICIFTGLLTPLGDTPYTYLIKTMQGNTTQSINEHLPMVLIQSTYMIIILAIILAILIFSDTKIKLKDLFMLGGLIILALMSKRQLSMLALIGVYSINRLICDFVEKYDSKGTEQFTKIIASGFGQIITVLLFILIGVVMYKPQVNDQYINSSSYPVEAAKYVKENLNVNEIRLYNEYNYGSYLIYQDIPVFIDSRADLYTPQFNGDSNKDVFTDFIRVSGVSVHYEEIFKKYDITHLLIPNNAKINLFISKDENYKELYKDKNFVIYERLNK